MTLVRNTFEAGVANGTAIDTVNSAKPTVFNAVTLGTGSAITYDSVAAFKGVLGMKTAPTASQTAYVEWNNITGATAASGAVFRLYFYMPALPATTVQPLVSLRTIGNGTGLVTLRITNTGALRIYSDVTAAQLGTDSTSTLAVNTWYRLEMSATNPTTTTGTVSVRGYLGDSTTPVSGLSMDVSAVNIGSSAIGTLRAGRVGAVGDAWVNYIDELAFSTGTTTLLGPAVSNVAPVAAISANVTGLPNAAISMTGTDSDADGVVASRAWSFSSVPTGVSAPTLTNATTATVTFTPTTPGRYVLAYQVTDDQGAVSNVALGKAFITTSTVSVIEVTANTGAWTLGGGAANEAGALSDASDTTYVQAPASPSSPATIRLRLAPLTGSPSSFALSVRGLLTAAGSGTATVALYEGSTLRKSWTVTPTTSVAAAALSLTTGEIATVTSWNELDVELSWGP